MLGIAAIETRAALQAPKDQIFVWYYIDLADSQGNGMVLIWSRGLPFLPQSRLEERCVRPSLHIVTYRARGPRQYLLQEFPNDEVEFDERTGNARFGKSTFTVIRTDHATAVRIALDIELPEQNQHWRGSLELSGPNVSLPKSIAPLSESHLWCPITVHARGRAQLTSRDTVFTIDGGGYFDSNSSTAPLQADGIRRWDWGRVQFPTTTLVYYSFYGTFAQDRKTVLLVFDAQGTTVIESTELVQSMHTTSRYTLTTPRRLEVTWQAKKYSIELEQAVELSPFYERYLLRATGPLGETGTGIGEVVLPSRVDQAWMRPFVRMKTHRLRRPNSMWLPLFSGATGTPWSRLWDSIWGTRHAG